MDKIMKNRKVTLMFQLFSALFCLVPSSVLSARNVIRVAPGQGDMTAALQQAIGRAAAYKGRPVVIELEAADYSISRDNASVQLYYVSNTASETENPCQDKHIGLWLKDLRNVTIDGRGARLVTHGEMTAFVIDGCENITLKNFTVTAADPTVPEMTVTAVEGNSMFVKVNPLSQYVIEDGRLAFVGCGWSLSGGIAQLYDPVRDVTWRSWSPLSERHTAEETGPGLLKLNYSFVPQVSPGMVFQMRDGIRDQVCGLIQYSRNVTMDNLQLAFLGNFGVVGQMSENITLRNMVFAPEEESGRTCAGFADFVQMSGCKGLVLIEDSRFSGAHDDPINIHGTHLSVREFLSPREVRVRYMHHQTYGFQSFMAGDEVEFVDPHTLQPLASFMVEGAQMESDREITITLDRDVPESMMEKKELVVENVTYTPEVIVRNCHFSRVPTRGILVSTRRRVLIEGNVFYRMHMSGILIADDARSWYESGMVRDVTVRGNEFVECGSPVIMIAPENDVDGGYVHSNVSIVDNRFVIAGGKAVYARSVDGLKVAGNHFETAGGAENFGDASVAAQQLMDIAACRNVISDL